MVPSKSFRRKEHASCENPTSEVQVGKGCDEGYLFKIIGTIGKAMSLGTRMSHITPSPSYSAMVTLIFSAKGRPTLQIIFSAEWVSRGVKMRIGPPYPQRAVKGD